MAVELWNYSEITPKLGTGIVTVELRNYGPGLWYCEIEDRGTMELLRSYTEITPKLLRNWGPWNYGITPKLWDWDYDRGTMELLRSYTELLRNYCGLL